MNSHHGIVLCWVLLAGAASAAGIPDEFHRMQIQHQLDKKRSAEAARRAEIERQKEVQAGEAAPSPKDKTPKTFASQPVQPPGAYDSFQYEK